MLTLAQLPTWAISILVVFYVLVSVIMVLAVLIQRPQGGGLSTAFGAGAGSGQTAFGTKIGDALTIFTIVVFLLFLGSSIGLVYLLRPEAAPTQTPGVTGTESAPEPSPAGASDATTGGDTPTGAGGEPGTPPGDVGGGAEPNPGTGAPDAPAPAEPAAEPAPEPAPAPGR